MLKKKIEEMPEVKEYILSERIKGLIEGTIFGMIAGIIYVVTIVGYDNYRYGYNTISSTHG